jgi:hypothetical protein
MNSTVSFALGVVTGVLTGFIGSVLSPLGTGNASSASDLRKKIDEVLFDLDEFVKYTPQDLRGLDFGSAVAFATDLKRSLESLRWYWFFRRLLGLPSKKDLRAAIEKLTEITTLITPQPGLYDEDRAGKSLPIGSEVQHLLRRRWSVF